MPARSPRTSRTAAPSAGAALPPKSAGRFTSRWPVALGLIAVLAIKAIALAQLGDHPLLQPRGVLDDAVYLKLAERVAGGDLWLGPDVYYLSPFYTYFLGAILALGGSVFAARLVQVVLGVVATALIADTARRWFGPRAAWAAGAAAALTGLFTFNEILLLQSAVDPFLSALALWAVGRALLRGRPASFLGAGAALGLLVINRPNSLVAVAAAAGIWLVLQRSRTAVLQLASLALGVAIVIAPVTVRNRVVAGEWALVTSHGGLNFYIGNHEGATGTWTALPGISPSIEGQSRDAARVASTALGRPVSAGAASDYYFGLAWKWIREHPAAAARLWLRKLALTFSATDLALNYSFTYYSRDESSILAGLVVGPWLLFPLGLAGLGWGLLASRASSRFAPFAAWAAFVPGYAASLVVFFVASRYRLPLLVAMCVGAGVAVDRALESLRSRQSLRLAVAAGVAAILAAIAWLPLEADTGRLFERTERIVQLVVSGQDERAERLLADTEPRHPQRALLLYRVGRAWQEREQHAKAVALFERALAADPGAADIHFSLGEALVEAGRMSDAIPRLEAARAAGIEPGISNLLLARAYQAGHRGAEAIQAIARAVETDDGNQQAVLMFAADSLAQGDLVVAEGAARAAVGRWPAVASAWELLGMALMLRDARAEGEAALREATRLDPSSATAHYHLALAAAQAGRTREAVTLLERTLRLKPDYPEAQQLLGKLSAR